MAKLKPLTVSYVPASCLLSEDERARLTQGVEVSFGDGISAATASVFGDADLTLVQAVRIERAIGKTAGLSAYMAVYGLRALVDLES